MSGDLVTLAREIQTEHDAAFGKAREALEHARRCGELLLQVKDSLKHGEWLPWVKEHVTVSDRQARRYMQLAQNWEAIAAKSDTVSNLTMREALSGLAGSADSQEEDLLVLLRLWVAEANALADDMSTSPQPARYDRLRDELKRLHDHINAYQSTDLGFWSAIQQDVTLEAAAVRVKLAAIRAMRAMGVSLPEAAP